MTWWLRFLFTMTFAVFWWREVQYDCPLTEDCPRVEQQTMVRDPEVFPNEEACTAAAAQREAFMRTHGWNYRLVLDPRGTRRPVSRASVRYRYLCKPLPRS